MADLITIDKKLDRIIELLEIIADVEPPAVESGDTPIVLEVPEQFKEVVEGWSKAIPPHNE